MASKTWDYIEVKLEDYDWRDQDCILFIEAEYSFHGLRGDDGAPDGEVELGEATVIRALLGPDQTEACDCQLKELTKHLRKNVAAMTRLEERCAAA